MGHSCNDIQYKVVPIYSIVVFSDIFTSHTWTSYGTPLVSSANRSSMLMATALFAIPDDIESHRWWSVTVLRTDVYGLKPFSVIATSTWLVPVETYDSGSSDCCQIYWLGLQSTFACSIGLALQTISNRSSFCWRHVRMHFHKIHDEIGVIGFFNFTILQFCEDFYHYI